MTQPSVAVSEQEASGERDRVQVLMSLLDIERWKAEAIVTGNYTARDPLYAYCVKRFGNYEEIARFLMTWVGWGGEPASADSTIGAEAAATLPWLWEDEGGVASFPRVRCITCDALPETLIKEGDVEWLGDAFRKYGIAVTEWERARLAETVQGKKSADVLLDGSRFPQFNPEQAHLLWGEDGSVLKERWRFFGFPVLPESVRADVWRSFELMMHCTVTLRTFHREGECHELTALALDAMHMWKRGHFPLFVSGQGMSRTLYVLTASAG